MAGMEKSRLKQFWGRLVKKRGSCLLPEEHLVVY